MLGIFLKDRRKRWVALALFGALLIAGLLVLLQT